MQCISERHRKSSWLVGCTTPVHQFSFHRIWVHLLTDPTTNQSHTLQSLQNGSSTDTALKYTQEGIRVHIFVKVTLRDFNAPNTHQWNIAFLAEFRTWSYSRIIQPLLQPCIFLCSARSHHVKIRVFNYENRQVMRWFPIWTEKKLIGAQTVLLINSLPGKIYPVPAKYTLPRQRTEVRVTVRVVRVRTSKNVVI